jgi:7,8-dihydro-6-hydroxymethylpterin-pyrophosphokinase
LSLSSLDLIIPHPSLHKRRFVLEPFGSLLKKTMDQSCTKTNIVL